MSSALKMNPNIADRPTAQVDSMNNRILVVDDEREIGRLYKEILTGASDKVVPIRSSRALKSQGVDTAQGGSEFNVTVAHSAEEALALVKRSVAQKEPFAMGFFDVLLGPGMDGIELVKEVHRLDPNLNAVFVTAYHDRSVDSIRTVLETSRVASWDYLNKPFSSGEIVQKARNFTSLWNLNHEKEVREALLAEAHRRLLAQERTASVAAVARGVSHEFGNILMQIMGKADLGRKKAEPEMRQSLEKILEATHRAAEILDRFKHLSNPNAAIKSLSTIRLNALIDESIELLEPTLKNHHVKICRVKSDPIEMVGYETSLLQVLVNLIINAAHAMGGSGQIDFAVTNLGKEVEICVRDYGPGIPKDMLEKVLEPFFTTKGDKGTGLGLAIAREIIEVEHHGEFQVKNHAVKGLEIIMRLPLRPPQEEQDENG